MYLLEISDKDIYFFFKYDRIIVFTLLFII